MKVSVDLTHVRGPYVDPTGWQNSTLRYTPPADFPAYMAQKIGKPKIHRAFVTLDEYWDYKTDTYYPDYEIGKCRYPVEELYYPYDWSRIVPAPTGVRFEAYLTSHAAEAEEVLLNVRRLEREVLDGVISWEKYEEVLENTLLYCKRLAPNIRYIELGNETNGKSFGGMTPEESARLYVRAHAVVQKINREQKFTPKLEIGGVAIAGILQNWQYWETTLRLLAKSEIGDAPMDFYPFHHYDYSSSIRLTLNGDAPIAELGGVEKLRVVLARHHALLKELGLPIRPVFLDECGRTQTTGNPGDSLTNACGIVTYLIGASVGVFEEMHPFPWCTFHNPALQISYTQFLLAEDGSYKATPNGYAVMMMHALHGERVESHVSETYGQDIPYRAIAVKTDRGVRVVCANTVADVQPITLEIRGLEDGAYTFIAYTVDISQNNCVTGKGSGGDLEETKHTDVTVTGGTFRITFPLRAQAFGTYVLEKI